MIAWGETRTQATQRLIAALKDTTILGVQTNQTFLLQILEEQFFTDGETFTTTIENLDSQRPTIDENILGQIGTQHYSHAQKSTHMTCPEPFSRLKGFRLGS